MSASIELTGSLTNANGPLASQPVALTQDASALPSATTGANGVFVTAPFSVALGDHTFGASYSGTNPASVSIYVGIRKISGAVSVEVATGEVVVITVTDPSGKTYTAATTTSSGGEWSVPYLALTRGTYSVQATVSADSKYSAATSPSATFSL